MAGQRMLPPPGQMPPGQMPPGQMPPGQMPPGQMPPGQMLPGQMPPGQMPPSQIPPSQMPPGPGQYSGPRGVLPHPFPGMPIPAGARLPQHGHYTPQPPVTIPGHTNYPAHGFTRPAPPERLSTNRAQTGSLPGSSTDQISNDEITSSVTGVDDEMELELPEEEAGTQEPMVTTSKHNVTGLVTEDAGSVVGESVNKSITGGDQIPTSEYEKGLESSTSNATQCESDGVVEGMKERNADSDAMSIDDEDEHGDQQPSANSIQLITAETHCKSIENTSSDRMSDGEGIVCYFIVLWGGHFV